MIGRTFPRRLRDAIVALLALVFVPLLAVIVAGFIEGRGESYAAGRERVHGMARVAQLSLQRLIADTRQTLFVLSHAPVVAIGAPDDCSVTLRRVMQANIVYANLAVSDAGGQVVCSAQVLSQPVDISDRLYFQRTVAWQDFGVGVYQVGRITGEPAVNFGFPIFNTRRTEVRRVIYAALDISWLALRLRQAKLPAATATWLIDEDGRVLASNAEGWVGQVISASALGSRVLASSGDGTVAEIHDLDGVRRLYAVEPVWSGPEGPLLRVAVGIPVADVYAQVNARLAKHLGLLGAGTLLLIILVLGLLRRLVLEPLDSLVAAARRLAAGDFAVRAARGAAVAEFAQLGDAFNELATALERRDGEIADHIVRVEAMSRRYRVLSATNQAIVHAVDQEELFGRVCEAVVERGGAVAAWIGTFDGADEEIVAGASASGDDWTLSAGLRIVSGDARVRLRSGELVVLDADAAQARTLPFLAEARRHGGLCFVGAAIMRDGRVVASLNVFAPVEAGWQERDGLALVREMTGDIGFALTNFSKDAEIRRLAFHDALTGLPNRHKFERDVDRVIGRAARRGLLVPVVKLELSALHRRIDRFGHDAGDFILRSLAGELETIMPADAEVARVGDDVFAVMLPPDSDPSTLRPRVEALLSGLPTRMRFGAQDLILELNAGVAIYPEDGENARTLLRASLLALDTLPRRHGNAVAFHSARLSVEAHERLQIERLLQHAVDEGELRLEFQPTVRVADRTPVGVEALLRWTSEELGVVPPGRFVPIAEQTGLVVPMGHWVLEETCRQLQSWHEQGSHPGYAAVNVSVVQFYDPHLVPRLRALLDRYPAARGRLAVEITETAMMDDYEHTREVLLRLRDLGLKVFVDDFGTGYSSLSYLRRLPVDTLKIDQVFTSELGTSEEALSVVRAILALGRSLGMTTLAEGIETEEQARMLESDGCDMGQGYLFARAMEPALIVPLFQTPRASAAHGH